MSKLKELLSKIITKVNASVKTEAQSLTNEEKAQARENIGAVKITNDKYDEINTLSAYTISQMNDDIVTLLAELGRPGVLSWNGIIGKRPSFSIESDDSTNITMVRVTDEVPIEIQKEEEVFIIKYVLGEDRVFHPIFDVVSLIENGDNEVFMGEYGVILYEDIDAPKGIYLQSTRHEDTSIDFPISYVGLVILPAAASFSDNYNISNSLPDTIPNIQNAAIGQTVIVKSVDENNIPTEWETATFPTKEELVAEVIAALPKYNGEVR